MKQPDASIQVTCVVPESLPGVEGLKVRITAKAPTDDPSDPDGLKPRLVTNWTQFEELYGGFVPGAMLPHSVYGYFNNGGGSCFDARSCSRSWPRHRLPSPLPS